MRILHVIDSGGLYGAETMLLSLMDEQKRLGDHPMLCSIGTFHDAEKDIEREAEHRGHDVFRVRMMRGLNLRGSCAILRIARERRVEVIHSHGYKGNIMLGFFTRKLRRLPMVSTLHGWTSSGKFSRMSIYEWLDCVSLNGVDAVITVNKTVRHSSKFRWCINKRVKCIPNGIPDSSAPYPALTANDTIATFCKGHFVVGSLGRLSAEKGYDILVHSFQKLHDILPDARLVIIGEGKERLALEQLIQQLGLSDYIMMPGFRVRASQYLQFFSCFVISSFTEGLPISLLEAMIAGAPIISTDVGGIAEALDSGKAGSLVTAGDVDSLYAAMLSVYNNPEQAKQRAILAKEIAISRYSAESMARSYRDVYAEVL